METKQISHNSQQYEEMIRLRMDVLLNPIGIPQSFINREKEKEDMLLGVYESDRLIGCCVLTEISKEEVQLRQMAVRAEKQSKGIGTALLYFAEQVAVENGYSILKMHARDAAVPFYSKSGYSISGEPFEEVGLLHFTMTKKLR